MTNQFRVGNQLVLTNGLWTPEIDLNEMRVWDWNSAVLPDGAVSSWADSAWGITATQSTPANQPTMSAAGGGVVFTGAQTLNTPLASDPWRFHRALVVIVKADVADTTANDSGTMFVVNGFTGSAGRAPLFGWQRIPSVGVTVQWAATGNSNVDATITLPWPDSTNFHVIVSRRVGGVHYMSIDGGAETSAGTNCIIPRSAIVTSFVGDIRTPAINFTLNRLMVLQDEVSNDMRDRIQGWAMWSIGRQAALPPTHPYYNARPLSNPFVNPYYITTGTDWDAVQPAYWANHFRDNYTSSMASWFAAAPQVFREDFTSISAIASESAAVGATATFFGPTIDQPGGPQTNMDPGVNSPAVFSQSGSVLTITMQKSGNTWYSGTLTSINLGGLGFTIDPSQGPVWAEASISFGTGNGFSIWGAPLWMESLARWYSNTTPYEELDVCECFNSENSGSNDHVTSFYHTTIHNVAGRIQTQRTTSGIPGRIFYFTNGQGWPNAPVYNVADGNFHKYQMYRDKNITIVGFDGLELGRFPTQPFMLNKLFLITTLNQLPSEIPQASGTYTMNIDYIRAGQGTY